MCSLRAQTPVCSLSSPRASVTIKHYRITFTNEQVICKKALHFQSHPFVLPFFFFQLKSIIYIAKTPIKLFKLKHLTTYAKLTSTLDASYAPAMQIKTASSTLRAASVCVFLFTFTVSALHHLIRQTQTHSTVLQGGKGPSFLPAIPPHVLRRETASMRLEQSPCLKTPCTSLLPYAQATEGKTSLSQMKLLPNHSKNIRNLPIFSMQAPRYPKKRHCCHFLKCKRTV